MNFPAKCPSCQRLVNVPEFQGEPTLRCPICEAEFSAATLTNVEAPTVEFVTDAATPTNDILQPGTVDDSNAEAAQVQIDAQPSVPSVNQSLSQPNPATTRVRATSRKNRSAKLELIKIALGGVAGLVIAQLILWWLPGDLRRDPFKVAPHIPDWLAFVTPAELRGTPPTIAESAPSAQQPDSTSEPLSTPDPTVETNRPTIDGTAINGTAIAPNESSSETVPDAPRRVQLKGSPLYPGVDLRNLLGDIRLQLEQYDAKSTDREARRNQLRRLYQRLCEIGEVVTFVDMNDPDVGRLMQASEALLARIANSPEQLELVGRAAVTWMSYASRVTDGVAIAGEVVSIQPQGELFESTIRFYAKPDESVRLVSQRDPKTDVRQAYGVGSNILAFGAIVSDPSERIQDYHGSGPIVWEGLHIVFSESDDRSMSEAR